MTDASRGRRRCRGVGFANAFSFHMCSRSRGGRQQCSESWRGGAPKLRERARCPLRAYKA
eukprot:scaffold6877_cov119-Isochrysis_galbana.AAC.5